MRRSSFISLLLPTWMRATVVHNRNISITSTDRTKETHTWKVSFFEINTPHHTIASHPTCTFNQMDSSQCDSFGHFTDHRWNACERTAYAIVSILESWNTTFNQNHRQLTSRARPPAISANITHFKRHTRAEQETKKTEHKKKKKKMKNRSWMCICVWNRLCCRHL